MCLQCIPEAGSTEACRYESHMNIEPQNLKERRALHRIKTSRHPAMRLAAPGLFLAAIILSYSALFRHGHWEWRSLSIFLAGVFLGQSWMIYIMLNDRKVIHDLFDRLTNNDKKDS